MRISKLYESLIVFFIHLKLELLTQFPASNDEKYNYLFYKDISNIELAEHLPKTILLNSLI